MQEIHAFSFTTSHDIKTKDGKVIKVDMARGNANDIAGYAARGYAISEADVVDLNRIADEQDAAAKLLTCDDERPERRDRQHIAKSIRLNLKAIPVEQQPKK